MSITHTDKIDCRGCGAAVEVFVADSLNAGRHPHLRQLVLDRKLHLFTCGACGLPFVVEKELMYIDFARRQMLGVFAWADRQRERECGEKLLEAFRVGMQEGAPAFIRELSRDFLVRACFGYEELREKLILDEGGLYDLAVEALKAELLAGSPEMQAAEVLTLRVDSVDGEQLWLCPEFVDGARPGEQLSVERALYEEVVARGTEQILAARPWLVSGPHVSMLRALQPR